MLVSLLALALLLGNAIPVSTEQRPILAEPSDKTETVNLQCKERIRPLHGRFLHITGIKSPTPVLAFLTSCLDFHPDQFYKPFSSTEKDAACHRGEGSAGIFGAETSDCDSPLILINATFQWINDNLKDSIDFVIWTGDSARHDIDEEIPRTEQQVLDLNTMLVTKFTEVFGKQDEINDTDPTSDFTIPIIPTFGNNDIMPHNILAPGPNRWTKKFSHVWKSFVPESQRHSFVRGGWFSVEVIPNELAVLSLNTLYFFDSNTAVDGCAKKSEPGYEHMEWLRIQLQFLRERGMKAILMGHVPPARTKSKSSWDETCWQKYALWMRQYRDVIVGSLYGHMNIEHFMLQDFGDIRKKTIKGRMEETQDRLRGSQGDEFTIQSSADYLEDLRNRWSKIPKEPASEESSMLNSDSLLRMIRSLWRKRKHRSKKQKYLEKIGGVWAERYSVSLVTASVVPNYFPTMRVIEYNTTGTDSKSGIYKKGKKKHHKKKPDFIVPSGPSKSSPPGPAYSPQTYTWLSYTQYYANLTRINHDLQAVPGRVDSSKDNIGAQKKWREGKHNDKELGHKPNPPSIEYEVEYNTKTDKAFGLKDLTVRSWLKLATRIGKYKPVKGEKVPDDDFDDQDFSHGMHDTFDINGDNSMEELIRRKKKHHHRKSINKVWFAFLRRAFVGTKDEDDLREEF